MVFKEVFLSDGTAISMTLQVLFLWSLITISGLLAAVSLCVHIAMYCSFFIFSDCPWFMFIPLVRHLDVVVLTCFPMYICSCLVVQVHIGSVPSFIILAWYDLVAKMWSCSAFCFSF